MKSNKILATIAAMALSVAAFAQEGVAVYGTVKDAGTGETIPLAGLKIKGTETGTVADLDGAFSFTVPAGTVLEVSSTGYRTKEVSVPAKGGKLEISLAIDAQVLEGAVSVGYGSSRRIGNDVGVVATVKSEIIKNSVSTSALDLLQGQVAGMSVLSTGGVVGDNNISMKIHGTGSLGSSSEPLFIVDGIQSSSSAVMAMNPADILSVSVLKDASSTSIYGAQGANGVVYVTTKAGSYEEKATVQVTSQYGISTLANINFYNNMMTGPQLKDFWMRTGILTADQIYANYTSQGYDADTKWHLYMQRFNNPQYQNTVSIEGGSKTSAYMVSASQFHQDGNTWGNYYDRYTVRSNVQAHPKDWLKFGLNLNGSVDVTQSNDNWSNSNGDDGNYTSGGLSFMINPLYPAVDENGKEYQVKYPNGIYNPYYYNEQMYRNDYTTYRLIGGAYIELEPLKNLIIRSQVGTDSYVEVMDRYLNPDAEFANGSGMVQKSTYMGTKNTITNTVEYSGDVNNAHKFSILAGQEGIMYDYKSWVSFSNGQTDSRLNLLQNGTADSRQVTESLTQYRFFSLFARADYSYQDRVFLDATIRNDASSRFGAATRNGMFWAAGAKWDLKKEDFFAGIRDINALSLRLSYGTQGNASIGNYNSLALIGSSKKYADEASLVVAQPANPLLGWEKQGLFTATIAGRYMNRIDFELSYYNRKTSDMLMDVPYPYTSGYSSSYANVGGLLNHGFDIDLGINLVRGRNYTLDFDITFSRNWEKITELFNGLDRWEIANTGVAYKVGSPVMFYMPLYAGVNRETGLPQWYLPYTDEETGEVDKDICNMDPEKVTSEFDEESLIQNTGIQRHEPINGGFGLSGRYGKFYGRVDFAFVIGKYLLNNDAYFFANPNVFVGDNQAKEVSDFWTPSHTDAKYPDWSQGAQMQFDTHMLEDASFLRLKTLMVGYNITDNLNVTLTGRNLLTATKYSGMDPEVDSNLTLGIPGNTRQVLVGIELNF